MENSACGTEKQRREKERRCIISRQAGTAAEMIRFVAGPEGLLVPDIKGNLPGRGAWVFARRALVEEAVKRKAFARALKQAVQTPADLAAQVDKLLLQAAMANLSLARRSGAVITGAGKVDAAIRAGQAVMVLHAAEAAADGRRKRAQAVHARQSGGGADKAVKGQESIKILSPFTAEELQPAFGADKVMHIAITKDRGAAGFIKAMARLVTYRGEA